MQEVDFQKLHDQMEENMKLGVKYYRDGNQYKGIEYLEKALGTFEIVGTDENKKIEILFYLGHAYQLRGTAHDFQIAEDYYQQILAMDYVPPEYYYKVQYVRGNAFNRRGQYEKAIEVFNQVQQDENPLLRNVWASQSYSYFLLGKYDDPSFFIQSVAYCEKVIETGDRSTDVYSLFNAHHNLGHIYYEVGENVKSMMSYQAAVENSYNDTMKYDTYTDMGLVLIRLSQYDLAWAYIDQAQKYFEKSKNIIYLAGCLFAKGKYYRQKGKVEEATNYFELALSGYRENEYYYGIVKTYFELYSLYNRIDTEKSELYYDQYKFYMNYVSSPGIERPEHLMEEESLLW